MRLDQREEVFVGKEDVLGRQQWTFAVGLQEVVARFRIAPEAAD